MPEIEHFAVAPDRNGRLVVVAIAGPGKDDPQFTPAVWLVQELPDGENQWPDTWRSLGTPGGVYQLDGITMASNASGGLEAAVLAQNTTVWHARQENADGDWSDWESLGNPVSGGSITPPALAESNDGRLELFTVSLLPRRAVWHRSQLQPGQNQWTGWSSIGFPGGQSQGELTAAAPAVALNLDGRLEVHLLVGGQIWHTWQKTADSHEWMPWSPLGRPEDRGAVGLPTVTADGDGRLHVFTASGPAIWMRDQPAPGLGPWRPWRDLSLRGLAGRLALALAAQAGGRLVLFALRDMPDGTQSLEKLEQEGAIDEQWLPGDPIETEVLGKPEFVPAVDELALGITGDERLRLFMSVRGSPAMYVLNQTSPAGGQWLESWFNFQAP